MLLLLESRFVKQPLVGNKNTLALKAIRADLVRGEWRPGERLQPMKLADRYSTSTTVIREALTRLVGEGLIEVEPNRGFFVPQLEARILSDITSVRGVVEGLAIEFAIARGGVAWESDVVAAHHRLSRTPRRLPDDPGHVVEAWVNAHREFHESLVAGAGVPLLQAFCSQLSQSTELYRRWASPSSQAFQRSVEEEHQAIVDAVLARDAPLAARLLREHYQRTTDVILASGLIEDAPQAE